MKWNILVATMVLGLGFSTQSFGFDLMDRMLGGCGCEQKGSAAACQKADDGKGCCQKAGLFGGLGGCAQKACDGKGDGKCGDACQKDGDKGCCQKAGLFSGLGGCAQKACDGKGDSKCGDACQKDGGKGKAMAAPAVEAEAPMPPAPVVDPSAFNSQRTIIHASTTLVN
jgi:hypothetical protein